MTTSVPVTVGAVYEPPPGVTYPLALTDEAAPGRQVPALTSLLGLVMGLSAFAVVPGLINQLVVNLSWLVLGRPGTRADFQAAAMRFDHPAGMLGAHLGIGSLILVTLALVVYWHHRRGRWLISVQPGMRWRYLLITLLAAAVVLNAVVLLAWPYRGHELSPQPSFWAFLVIIVLTSPLQAAAEEFFFRGYLMQTLGAVFRSPWVGIVGSAVIFALFHGVQNPPLFVDRLVFGLLAGLLVVRTGGLEAAIAAHIVNNLCAFIYASLFSTVAAAKATTTITWAEAGQDIMGFALFALVASVLARRMRLATTTPEAGSV